MKKYKLELLIGTKLNVCETVFLILLILKITNNINSWFAVVISFVVSFAYNIILKIIIN